MFPTPPNFGAANAERKFTFPLLSRESLLVTKVLLVLQLHDVVDIQHLAQGLTNGVSHYIRLRGGLSPFEYDVSSMGLARSMAATSQRICLFILVVVYFAVFMVQR